MNDTAKQHTNAIHAVKQKLNSNRQWLLTSLLRLYTNAQRVVKTIPWTPNTPFSAVLFDMHTFLFILGTTIGVLYFLYLSGVISYRRVKHENNCCDGEKPILTLPKTREPQSDIMVIDFGGKGGINDITVPQGFKPFWIDHEGHTRIGVTFDYNGREMTQTVSFTPDELTNLRTNSRKLKIPIEPPIEFSPTPKDIYL